MSRLINRRPTWDSSYSSGRMTPERILHLREELDKDCNLTALSKACKQCAIKNVLCVADIRGQPCSECLKDPDLAEKCNVNGMIPDSHGAWPNAEAISYIGSYNLAAQQRYFDAPAWGEEQARVNPKHLKIEIDSGGYQDCLPTTLPTLELEAWSNGDIEAEDVTDVPTSAVMEAFCYAGWKKHCPQPESIPKLYFQNDWLQRKLNEEQERQEGDEEGLDIGENEVDASEPQPAGEALHELSGNEEAGNEEGLQSEQVAQQTQYAHAQESEQDDQPNAPATDGSASVQGLSTASSSSSSSPSSPASPSSRSPSASRSTSHKEDVPTMTTRHTEVLKKNASGAVTKRIEVTETWTSIHLSPSQAKAIASTSVQRLLKRRRSP